jgi:competence protein ComEC
MLIAPLAAFVLGVCALQWQGELPSIPALLVASVGAVVLIALGMRSRSTRAALITFVCSGALLAGFAYAGARAHERLADALAFADEGRDVMVTGVVASLPVRLERGVRFEFDVESHAADVAVPRRLQLGWYAAGEPVQPGERWRFEVRLRRPHGAVNPGGFDFEAWMLERNLRASGYVRTPADRPPHRLQSMVWSPGVAIERARAWLRDRLVPHLQAERYGGVVLALVLGDQRAIADADWTLFNRTGITHLVSISGLHITMIAALAGGITGAFWRRTPWLLRRAPAQTAAIVAGVTVALLYALLAGWGIPAQRTVLMLVCVAAAWTARARMTSGVSLALAATAVCVFDPWCVTAAGFWLSFGAVAAIIWVVQGRPRRGGSIALEAVATATRVQIAVTLALVPATVVLFQQMSVVAPFANAIAIPLISWVVTPLALVGAGVAALPDAFWPLASFFLGIASSVFAGLAAVLAGLSAPSWAALAVPAPPWWVTAFALAGIVWLLAPPGWPVRRLGAVALLPLFVWPVERPAAGGLWVTALDVGQGSAVVLETRDHAWLYDTGPRYSQDSDAGERVILPFLRSRGIQLLDGVVVSHLDLDHSGGAASVLRGIEVRRRVSSVAPGHSALGGADVERCVAGLTMESGDMSLQVLHPLADDYGRRVPTNAMSCVVLARVGGVAVLLTGDVPASGEAALVLREPALRADWMMAPHHGSHSSSSATLLESMAPVVAVAQVGYRNRFGHPDPRVAARYASRGIELVRTDHAGAVQWRYAPGNAVEYRSWRATAVRYWHDRPAAGQADAVRELDDALEDSEPREPLFGMP